MIAFARMNVADFNYHLPPHLIAQFPAECRTDSRLLHLDANGEIHDGEFPQIVDFLQAGDLLVLNNTKVIPARLFGRKETGGKLEVLLERVLDEHTILAQVRSSRAPKVASRILIDGDDVSLTVEGRQDSFFVLRLDSQVEIFEWLERVGHMPLPPYIERGDEALDIQRYQTVFAHEPGAVAAPTAGLHFDQATMDQLRAKGVNIEFVTLHVGAGTYQPVRVDSVEQHKMHSEFIDVGQSVCDAISRTKVAGGRVCAVGTTVVRSLESAARNAADAIIQPFSGETDIFIYPGYEFKVVDVMQTNFHLPESTLLMLVAAFSGYQEIMQAYQHAIDKEYRFFSYGDAMLLEKAR